MMINNNNNNNNDNNAELNFGEIEKIYLYFAELYTETLKVQNSCTLVSPYIVKIVPFGFLLRTVKRPAFKREICIQLS